MMTEQKTQLIRSYVARRLGWLQTQAEHPQTMLRFLFGKLIRGCGIRHIKKTYLFHFRLLISSLNKEASS